MALAGQAPRPRLARLRRVLLAALILFLGLLGLFLFGRSGGPAPETAEETGEAAEGTLVLAGEGFDYQVTRGENPLFRVRAERILSRREKVYTLEEVALTYFREDGSRFEIAAGTGTYDVEAQEARLAGGARVEGPRQLVLEAEGLRFERGSWLLSSSPVAFRFAGRFTGRAGGMSVNLRKNLFHLLDGVSVRSLPGEEPPVSLAARRLVYHRDHQMVRADEGVTLERGSDRLRAARITVHLTEPENRVRFIRGRRGVVGHLTLGSAEEATPLDFRGDGFSFLLDPRLGQPQRGELEGGGGEPALVASGGVGQPQRRLTASYLVGTFAGGELRQVEAFPPVRLVETPAGGEPRRILAQKATVTFEPGGGGMGEATFTGGVTYHGPDGLVASGGLARFDFAADRAELLGAPARAESPRGELEAPRIVRLGQEQLLHAEGGVEALLREEGGEALAAGPLGEGQGPVRVESQEAFWREGAEEAFLFRGEVRAWQRENVLLAAELRGEVPRDLLTASGGVKTLWVPEEEEGSPATAGEGPIQVTAERLTYDGRTEILRYAGGVRVQRAGRALQCREAEAELAEGEVQTMACLGEVRIEDPQTARSVEGERAVYRLADGEVRVTGEPVILRDRDGAQIQGPLLVYNLDTGSAQMRGPDAEGPSG